ncbi:cyclin-dependent kinase inhibitor 7-like isoform X2 [Lycium ferocissimum]|uniref:cyclin-dependent kinase inhibitor 7-like isoform X2 n=1 Tax=Lycium ferocissimum TaxID=112874 RepID=UPI00281635F8|nr:cyclin-dependent kinase inhibitor 7-like isoform X2 [Lycium ferocissimum]
MEVAVKMTKKRKMCDGDLERSPTVARVRSRHSGVLVALASLESPVSELSSNGNTVLSKPAVGSNFDDALASCFADNNGSSDISSKFIDLDGDSVKIANSNSEVRKSECKVHKLETTPRRQHAKPRCLFTETTMPSEVDQLDEFFAAAEKDLHKRFAEKYNFDFAKEEPLEGRYEWIRQ